MSDNAIVFDRVTKAFGTVRAVDQFFNVVPSAALTVVVTNVLVSLLAGLTISVGTHVVSAYWRNRMWRKGEV